MKEMGEELMLYDIERDAVHILNAAAGMIYRLHCQGKGIVAIEQAVCRRFSFDGNQNVHKDIAACIEELRMKGLTVPVL